MLLRIVGIPIALVKWLFHEVLFFLGYRQEYERVVIGKLDDDPLRGVTINDDAVRDWLKGARKESVVGSTPSKDLKRIIKQAEFGSYWVITDRDHSYLIILAKLGEEVGIASIHENEEQFVVLSDESFEEAVQVIQRSNGRYRTRAILKSMLSTASA